MLNNAWLQIEQMKTCEVVSLKTDIIRNTWLKKKNMEEGQTKQPKPIHPFQKHRASLEVCDYPSMK